MAYNQRRYNEPELPRDYLQGGYFEIVEKNGCKVKKLKKDLVLKTASNLAKDFGTARPGLKKAQLRKFYDYSRNMEEKLRMCKNYDLIESDINKLIAFAADAKSKGNIPQIFFDFIERNVNSIHNEDDFIKGFIEHFQAVVAYFSYHNPRA